MHLGIYATSKIPGKILYKEECFKIQGALFEVYKEMGPGFLESVYQECIEIEFQIKRIPFESQKDLQIWYNHNPLKQHYKVDLICYEKIIVELKAISELEDIHRAKILNYLRATGLRLGLLVNFCSYPKVTIERIAL
jgi:GxxExxY protein